MMNFQRPHFPFMMPLVPRPPEDIYLEQLSQQQTAKWRQQGQRSDYPEPERLDIGDGDFTIWMHGIPSLVSSEELAYLTQWPEQASSGLQDIVQYHGGAPLKLSPNCPLNLSTSFAVFHFKGYAGANVAFNNMLEHIKHRPMGMWRPYALEMKECMSQLGLIEQARLVKELQEAHVRHEIRGPRVPCMSDEEEEIAAAVVPPQTQPSGPASSTVSTVTPAPVSSAHPPSMARVVAPPAPPRGPPPEVTQHPPSLPAVAASAAREAAAAQRKVESSAKPNTVGLQEPATIRGPAPIKAAAQPQASAQALAIAANAQLGKQIAGERTAGNGPRAAVSNKAQPAPASADGREAGLQPAKPVASASRAAATTSLHSISSKESGELQANRPAAASPVSRRLPPGPYKQRQHPVLPSKSSLEDNKGPPSKALAGAQGQPSKASAADTRGQPSKAFAADRKGQPSKPHTANEKGQPSKPAPAVSNGPPSKPLPAGSKELEAAKVRASAGAKDQGRGRSAAVHKELHSSAAAKRPREEAGEKLPPRKHAKQDEGRPSSRGKDGAGHTNHSRDAEKPRERSKSSSRPSSAGRARGAAAEPPRRSAPDPDASKHSSQQGKPHQKAKPSRKEDNGKGGKSQPHKREGVLSPQAKVISDRYRHQWHQSKDRDRGHSPRDRAAGILPQRAMQGHRGHLPRPHPDPAWKAGQDRLPPPARRAHESGRHRPAWDHPAVPAQGLDPEDRWGADSPLSGRFTHQSHPPRLPDRDLPPRLPPRRLLEEEHRAALDAALDAPMVEPGPWHGADDRDNDRYSVYPAPSTLMAPGRGEPAQWKDAGPRISEPRMQHAGMGPAPFAADFGPPADRKLQDWGSPPLGLHLGHQRPADAPPLFEPWEHPHQF